MMQAQVAITHGSKGYSSLDLSKPAFMREGITYEPSIARKPSAKGHRRAFNQGPTEQTWPLRCQTNAILHLYLLINSVGSSGLQH